MPFKTCGKCQAKSGPRVLYCKCGAPFIKTLKAFGHHITSKPKAVATVKNDANVVVNNNFMFQGNGSGFKFNPSDYHNSFGPLNLNPGTLFDDLYGKSDALTIIMSALKTYNDTDGAVRIHSLIIGSPSSGKTELLNRIELMVGKDQVFRTNSESMSKAGAENSILNFPGPLPPILIIEELEKTDPDNLRWLLSAIDTRQEIIKITAKEGVERRSVPFICIGTCNNLEKLQKMHSGSIASRFSNKVFVKDMDDSTLCKILIDNLHKIPNHDIRWAQAAIDLARELGEVSVRKCLAIMFCGREKLLTGEYAKILKSSSVN